MATIRSRGNKQWQAMVRRHGWPDQSKTFNTKAEAETWGRMVEGEMDRGVFVSRDESERMLFAEAVDQYIEREVPRMKSQRNAINNLRALAREFGKYSLAAITPALLSAYRDRRLASGTSPQTVKHDLGWIQRVYRAASMDWGIALPLGIPTEFVRNPSVPKGRNRRLLPGEGGALLGAADMRLSCLIVLAIETAMRRREIASMTWENVDMRGRSIYLPKTKNDEARTVPLSPAALEALSLLPRNLSGSVFGWTESGIDSAWDRARVAAGIPGGWSAGALHLHDLRHEATSRFFEHTDLDIMEIKAITGHKSLQMLARYTHLRTARLADRLAGARRGGA